MKGGETGGNDKSRIMLVQRLQGWGVEETLLFSQDF